MMFAFRPFVPRAILALLSIVLSACSEAEEGWTKVVEPKRFVEKTQLAERARDAIAQQLKAELTAAIAQGGPASGIRVCKDRAPSIAQAVGKQHGVAIGRTSFRLRNPVNRVPSWAQASVQARSSEPEFFESARGGFAALFPIRLAGQCVVCHGQPESFGSDLRAALGKRYPEDRATGFKEGDLRGWFWVEMQ